MVLELEKELEVELVKKKSEAELRREELIEKSIKFTNEVRKKYGELIKSVLIFGSVAKGKVKKTSDADVWVILDDTATKSSQDLEKVATGLYLTAERIEDLHIQTTALTEFWQWVKVGSPELVNFLRYGLVIYDTGFVKPVQRMLNLGLLPPSEEAISLKSKSAELRYKKVRREMKSMVFDLRYSASDIIQAVVMHFYKQQPDQKEFPKWLERLVKEGKLEDEWIEKWVELNKLWKDLEHGKREMSVKELGKALALTQQIIDRFKKLIPEDILKVGD